MNALAVLPWGMTCSGERKRFGTVEKMPPSWDAKSCPPAVFKALWKPNIGFTLTCPCPLGMESLVPFLAHRFELSWLWKRAGSGPAAPEFYELW